MTAAFEDESEAAFIVRRMTEIGFHPSASFEADRVTFFKEYADDRGRRARVYAYFDKPVLNMTGMRLSNLVINVPMALEPSLAAISDAPPIARDDLAEVVRSFSALIGFVPDQAVVTRVCIKCKQPKSSFFTINGDAVCRDCVEERRSRE